MSTTAGRVVCSQCGANNFDTQAACWKCGASLSGGGVGVTGAPPHPVATPPRTGASTAPPPIQRPVNSSAASAAMPISPAPVAAMAPARPTQTVDPAVAGWAAAFLGLLLPYVAVPVGIVFLMLDDRRKIEVGRITIIWGIVGTIFHTLVTIWLVQAALAQLPFNLLQMRQRIEQGQAVQQSQMQQRQPRLTDEAAPLELPGFPRVGR